MPAKKTLQSLRVRGAMQMDIAPIIKGVPLVPHRLYRAMLTQSAGNDAVAQVFINTFPALPVWTFDADGVQVVTLAGVFPADKTFCLATVSVNSANGRLAMFSYGDLNTCILNVFDNQIVEVNGFQVYVEITVYV